MIDRLELKNFKCFREQTVDFKKLTILTGANAAGKSSVIQAILLLRHSNDLLGGLGEKRVAEPIDINQVLGLQVGAPNALVSQNPTDDNAFDFAFVLSDGGDAFEYLYEIDKSSPLDLIVKAGRHFDAWNLQYLNAERVGPRTVNQAGQRNGIVQNGENAAYLMDIADKTDRKIAEGLAGEGVSDKFSYHVEKWMSAVLGDMQLDFHTDYNKAVTELKIKNKLVDKGIVPTLTGFGISYALPVITAGLWASGEERPVLILENPEAHLHPYAQSNIGKFLAFLASCGVQVIVETHSEHVIDGARYQMARLGLSGDMLVNFMQQEDTEIKISALSVSPVGELSMWPRGFFDQKQQDLRDIMMLRRTKT